MTTTVYLPPEVCGLLSVAQRHLNTLSKLRKSRWNRHQRQKHESKVQRAVSRAMRFLTARNVPLEVL